ncbi:unnamed protein product [Moneuplotes crassus]|uniref:Uncharacterized protein n=1 Tax=Euplotes crassus TaxID=5936 RepID=A0AAD2D4H5_EUPCR|nr:unnamed protein product [Moneuplotes crassus]
MGNLCAGGEGETKDEVSMKDKEHKKEKREKRSKSKDRKSKDRSKGKDRKHKKDKKKNFLYRGSTLCKREISQTPSFHNASNLSSTPFLETLNLRFGSFIVYNGSDHLVVFFLFRWLICVATMGNHRGISFFLPCSE